MATEDNIARSLVYVESVFTDQSWKVYSREDREGICESGWIYVTNKPEGKFAAFIAQRQSADKDFAVNSRSFEHVLLGDRESRLAAGFVVLTEDFRTVLNRAHVEEVAAKLRGASPRFGRWGAYFWIDKDFHPVRSTAYTAQEDDKF